ncbi:MAG: hypothetical protein H6907_13545 [Hyphomicrobiales bacterium]|nr:hypothetical protein [Hyphomicrobiales bacterium]
MVKTLALAAAVILAAGPAAGGADLPACGQRSQVVDGLSRVYEELPLGLGVTGSGGVVEVLASPTGGTWSIIVTWPDGRSCLVAAGNGWQSLDGADPAALGRHL